MALRSGDALRDQLALQLEHQLAVLGVHGRQCAQLDAAAEAVHQGLVVAHDGVLVGHEVLEAGHAMLARQRSHVAVHGFVPPGDRDMEGIVAGGLLGPAAPGVEGLHQRLPRVRDHEVDDAGGAASEARGGAGVEIVADHRAHEGQLHVGVGIDAAGNDQAVPGIDQLRAGRRFQFLADRRDAAGAAQHVGAIGAFGVDHGAATDQDRIHARALRVPGLPRLISSRYTTPATASPTNQA